MAVLFDSATSGAAHVSPAATGGGVSATINVNPQATNLVAIACVVWTGTVDTTGATFGVTFGGTAMTANGAAVRWNSNKEYMQWFILDGSAAGSDVVPTGSRSVAATVSSMPTEGLIYRTFLVVAATYSNVATIDDPVVVTPSTTTSNSVTVTSVAPAHRVVTAHSSGNSVPGLGSYTKTLRATTVLKAGIFASGAHLLLGDAAGAASVTATATQPSTAKWGARGLSLAPVPVVASASLTVSVVPSAAGGTYRTATPVEWRYWTIPAIGTDDASQVTGNFVRSADDVKMPVWIKDPQDVEDYSLDWSNIIADDDQIISARFSPTSSALNVFSTNITESEVSGLDNVVTSCWLTGGVTGVNYGVTCHVVTAEGRQHDRTFRVVIGQK